MTSTSLPKCWRRYVYLSSTYGFRLGIPSFSNLSSTTVRQYSVKAFVLRLHVVFIVTRVLRLIGRGRSSALFQVLAHKVIIIAKKYASHFVSGNHFQYCTESVQFEVFSNMYYSRNFQASKHSLFLVWGSRFWFWEEWHIERSKGAVTWLAIRLKGQSGLRPVFATPLLPL